MKPSRSPRPPSRSRLALRVGLAAAIVLAALEIGWLLTAGWIVSSGRLATWVHRKPERIQIEWRTVHSRFPGVVAVDGFVIRGRTPRVIWQVTADRAWGVIDPLPLLHHELRFGRIEASGVTVWAARRRDLPETTAVEDEPAPSTRIPFLPPISGFAGLPEPQPPPANRAAWSWSLPSIAAADVRDLWFEEMRLSGQGSARGGFGLRQRREAEVFPGTLDFHDVALVLRGAEVGSGLAGRIDARLAPWPYHVVKGWTLMDRVTGELELTGDLAASSLLGALFEEHPWLGFESPPAPLTATLEVVAGRLSGDSRLKVSSPEHTLRLFDFALSGGAEIVGRHVADASGDRLEVDLATDRYRLATADGRAVAEGDGLHLHATTRDTRLQPKLAGVSLAVDLGRARLAELAILGELLPQAAGVTIVSGHGELAGRVDLSTATDSGQGEIEVKLHEVGVDYGDTHLAGEVNVQLALAGTDLKARRFDIVRSRCELTRFRTSGSTEVSNATREWWGHADLTGSQIVLVRPVTSAGVFHAELRDSAPLVALYAARRDLPEWVTRLLTVEGVHVDGSYAWQPGRLEIRNLVAPAAEAELRAGLVLGKAGERHGRMLLTWRRLALGIQLEGPSRSYKLAGARKWYESEEAASAKVK